MKKEINEQTVKSKKAKEVLYSVAVKLFCVIAAICLWLYVEESLNVTAKSQFDLIKIEARYTDRLEKNDLVVQSMSHDTVNVVLTGTRNALKNVNAGDIVAYVDLSDVSDAGEYQCAVKLSVPAGFAASVVADIPVMVYVDKATTVEFEIKNDDMLFDSWSIASDCKIDSERSYLNIDKVALEGTTLEIEKISKVRVKTQAIGMISTDVSSACVFEYYDKDGNILSGLNVNARAYSEGNEVADVVAYIKLIKEKEVFLTAASKYGYESDIKIKPESVIIKGTPAAVDAISEISVGIIDERSIPADKSEYTVMMDDASLPNDIYEVADKSGEIYENNIIYAFATVNIGRSYKLKVPSEYVDIICGATEFVTSDSFIELNVRISDFGDESIYSLLQKRLDDKNGGVTIIADARYVSESETSIPYSVIFSSDFDGKIYEIFDKPYTVDIEMKEADRE